MDPAGLLLLGLAFSLISLTLNLAPSVSGRWSNPSMIAMLVVGIAILGLVVALKTFLAPDLITSKRTLTNSAVPAALMVNVIDLQQLARTTSRATYSSSSRGRIMLGQCPSPRPL